MTTNTSELKLHIYVFSYNRGSFLRNCLDSLQECAPEYQVTVIDDGSKDNETIEVLNDWKDQHEIIVVNNAAAGDQKTGGLHNNMNYAFNHARKNRIKYILFMQDDVQLVRRIQNTDLQRAINFFRSNQNSFELSTTFLKEKYQTWDKSRMTIDTSVQAYMREYVRKKSGMPGCVGFSDVGLFEVDRFFKLFGDLESSEVANEMKARERGISLGFDVFPFMHWLPYPISHRGKKRTLYHRLVEIIAGAGFHPIQYMSKEEENKFLNRPQDVLPVAERFLISPTCPYARIWATEGGLDSLPPRGGWRNILEKLLRRVERLSRVVKYN